MAMLHGRKFSGAIVLVPHLLFDVDLNFVKEITIPWIVVMKGLRVDET